MILVISVIKIFMNNTSSKTSFYFIGIVIALAILGWLFYSFGGVKMNSVNSGNGSPTVTGTQKVTPPSDSTIKKNKAEIMALVAKKTPLTQAEKSQITAALNGELINFYGFTEQDKKAIIDALNK
jgi:hypothetical protein